MCTLEHAQSWTWVTLRGDNNTGSGHSGEDLSAHMDLTSLLSFVISSRKDWVYCWVNMALGTLGLGHMGRKRRNMEFWYSATIVSCKSLKALSHFCGSLCRGLIRNSTLQITIQDKLRIVCFSSPLKYLMMMQYALSTEAVHPLCWVLGHPLNRCADDATHSSHSWSVNCFNAGLRGLVPWIIERKAFRVTELTYTSQIALPLSCKIKIEKMRN